MASSCRVNLGFDFFSTSELLYPNMKTRLQLIRARPNFRMISENHNFTLEIADCSLYTHRIALEDEYHKKRREMLAHTPVEFNYLETVAKTSSFLPDKTISIKETFSTMFQFFGLLLHLLQTLHPPIHTLKIHSGVNNSISDKLEYSEGSANCRF